MTDMTDLAVTDAQGKSRYELTRGDGTLLATLDYRDSGEIFTVQRVFTVPAHRGHGYAAHLVSKVVEDLEQRGDRRVASLCWFASDWLEDHPQHHHLLA